MVTIKDIAQRLGVAASTVSMALKDSPQISEKRRREIKQTACEMNYVPNPFGRALQAQRSPLTGYLTKEVSGSFYDLLLQGAGETAVKHGYGMLTGVVSSCKEVNSQLEIFRKMRVEGIVVALGDLTGKLLPLLEKSGFSLVFCSSRGGPDHPFVMCDDIRGGEIAAAHLAERGHRVFACQNNDSLRLKGNLNVLRDRGLPDPVLFDSADDLADILRKHPDITAITAYSDNEAIHIHIALHKLGLRIPEDVALVGFDDLWFAGLENFRFTTIAQPKREIGQQAMELLLEIVNGTVSLPRQQLLPPELIIREST